MRIFVVGNNDYPRNPLSGGIADAMSWKEFFKNVRDVVSVATNAKRSVIEAGLAWVAERGGLFTYAGHGTTVIRNGNVCEAICPLDMATSGVMADYEIAKILAVRGNPVTCILDCCHGNNEFYGRNGISHDYPADGSPFVSRFIPVEGDAERSDDAVIQGLWAKQNVALLNACKSNQSSYERDGHGLYTTALQAIYEPKYSLREWVNRAGRYIRTNLDCDIQTPRAVGNELLLKGKLL